MVFLMSCGYAKSISAKEREIMVGIGANPISQGWNLGYHGMARMSFPFTRDLDGGEELFPTFDFLVGIDVNLFRSAGASPVSSQATRNNMQVLGAMGEVRINLVKTSATIAPFLILGPGVGVVRTSRLKSDRIEMRMLASAGAGIAFKTHSDTKLFLQARTTLNETGQNFRHFPITLGVSF